MCQPVPRARSARITPPKSTKPNPTAEHAAASGHDTAVKPTPLPGPPPEDWGLARCSRWFRSTFPPVSRGPSRPPRGKRGSIPTRSSAQRACGRHRWPSDLLDREALDLPHRPDLGPLLHADHPSPPDLDLSAESGSASPRTLAAVRGGSVFDRREGVSIPAAPTRGFFLVAFETLVAEEQRALESDSTALPLRARYGVFDYRRGLGGLADVDVLADRTVRLMAARWSRHPSVRCPPRLEYHLRSSARC